MSWKNIIKQEPSITDLKNQIDEYDKTQRKDTGPLIIFFSANKTGPHPRASRSFYVNSPQQLEELKKIYSKTNRIKEEHNAFMVFD